MTRKVRSFSSCWQPTTLGLFQYHAILRMSLSFPSFLPCFLPSWCNVRKTCRSCEHTSDRQTSLCDFLPFKAQNCSWQLFSSSFSLAMKEKIQVAFTAIFFLPFFFFFFFFFFCEGIALPTDRVNNFLFSLSLVARLVICALHGPMRPASWPSSREASFYLAATRAFIYRWQYIGHDVVGRWCDGIKERKLVVVVFLYYILYWALSLH